MTVPDPNDPLVCINTRLAGGEPTCNTLESDHCEGCRMCPGLGNCTCATPSPWKKGDRVRITFDAVYLTEPSIKPDKYALVVLPGTDLDGNVLQMDRFRVPHGAISGQDTSGAIDPDAGQPYSGMTGTELALRSDLRRDALDAYSVVFEPSNKLVRDHHKAIDAAIAATLLRLADAHEHITNGERCCGPAPEPQCLRCGPGDETATWLRVTAYRLDPDLQRRMSEDM